MQRLVPVFICLCLITLCDLADINPCAPVSQSDECTEYNPTESLRFITPGNLEIKSFMEGTFVELNCEAENFCSVNWTKDALHDPFDTNVVNDFCYDEDNTVLFTPGCGEDCEGNYTCIVANNDTEIKRTFILTQEDTVWREKPFAQIGADCKTKLKNVGEDVFFNCSFCGGEEVKNAKVGWWKKQDDGTKTTYISLAGLHSEKKYEMKELRGFCLQDNEDKHVITYGVSMYLRIKNIGSKDFGSYTLAMNSSLNGTVQNVILSAAPPGSNLLNIMIIVSIVVIFVLSVTSYLVWRKIELDAKLLWRSKYGKVEDGNHQYDAYIAYDRDSDEDRNYALLLMDRLEKCNYKVFVTDVHALPGSSLVEVIIEAMEKSYRIILIMSPTFIHSSHFSLETEFARDQLLQRKSKIIPILHPDVNVGQLEGPSGTMMRLVGCLKQEDEKKDERRFLKKLLLRMPKTGREDTSREDSKEYSTMEYGNG